MSDPLNNGGRLANSAGTPQTTPLGGSNLVPQVPSSISASNSPLPGITVMNSVSTSSGIGLQSNLGNTNLTNASLSNLGSIPTSTSNTNLNSFINAVPSTRQISLGCFEFFYNEMVNYLVTSTGNSDKSKAFKKIDKLGFKVGSKLAERLSMETTLFPDILDTVKFICRVFWPSVFKKSIDNLKTNHKGVFLLIDKQFLWFQHLSHDPTSTANKDNTNTEYVQFACGLIRGAMTNFGHKCTVSFEVQPNHACNFTIKVDAL